MSTRWRILYLKISKFWMSIPSATHSGKRERPFYYDYACCEFRSKIMSAREKFCPYNRSMSIHANAHYIFWCTYGEGGGRLSESSPRRVIIASDLTPTWRQRTSLCAPLRHAHSMEKAVRT